MKEKKNKTTKKEVKFQFRLSAKEAGMLRQQAEAEQMSESEYLRYLIRSKNQ